MMAFWRLTLYRGAGDEAERTTAVCRADSLDEARRQLDGMFDDGWVLVEAKESAGCSDALGEHAASKKQVSTKKWELLSLEAERRRRRRGRL